MCLCSVPLERSLKSGCLANVMNYCKHLTCMIVEGTEGIHLARIYLTNIQDCVVLTVYSFYWVAYLILPCTCMLSIWVTGQMCSHCNRVCLMQQAKYLFTSVFAFGAGETIFKSNCWTQDFIFIWRGVTVMC